jgi:hypothetical protein
MLCACEPEYNVGNWNCGTATPEGDSEPVENPVEVPWTSSFDLGFCDYVLAQGFCYADEDASYEIVDSPVRSGRTAAAFSITTDSGRSGTRCVREGLLPPDAIYGAWFWIPEKIEPRANWNLMHFQDSEPGTPFQYRWDVSLGISDDGDLSLHVLEFPTRDKFTPTVATTVPIGAWFHVEFRWLRADAPDGRVTLFQDGVPILDLTDIDASGFDFGQWHVGNLADDLEPANSTLYVDDVGIRRAP